MLKKTYKNKRLIGVFLALSVGVALLYTIKPWRFGEGVRAASWARYSAEYHIVCRQVYRQATEVLDRALADQGWNAALERPDGKGVQRPPAIIIDIDETLLGNMAFFSAPENRLSWSKRRWENWVGQAKAPLVPGASAFLAEARRRGVTIFYITNRAHELEAATLKNLRAHGLNVNATELLMRNERPGWGADKSSRRRRVTESHRVLLMLGDALGDFFSIDGQTSIIKQQFIAGSHDEKWGKKWFLLPNPVYGAWMKALDEESK